MRLKNNHLMIFTLLTLLTSNACAYKPDVHEPLLNTALSVYNQCFPGDTIYDKDKEAASIVLEGDIAMDKGLKFDLFHFFSLKGEKVFSLSKRPLNWHFYNPYKEKLSRVGLVEQSHSRLFNDLISGLESNTKKHYKLLFIGGLIHLIEDLSVPAHVVPVYHGPTIIKAFGPKRLEPLVSYMQEYKDEYKNMIEDAIDSIRPDTLRLGNELMHNNLICNDIEINDETLEQIRFQTALNTLNLLKEEIPECPNVTWQEFWIAPESDEYFGRYNIKNDNPLFGEAGLMKAENGFTCKFEKNDSRYKNFVFTLHLNAVNADLKLLNWSNKNILK